MEFGKINMVKNEIVNDFNFLGLKISQALYIAPLKLIILKIKFNKKQKQKGGIIEKNGMKNYHGPYANKDCEWYEEEDDDEDSQ